MRFVITEKKEKRICIMKMKIHIHKGENNMALNPIISVIQCKMFKHIKTFLEQGEQ